MDGNLGEDRVVPSDTEAVGLVSEGDKGKEREGVRKEAGLTFIGRLDGKRSLDSKAWFVMLCRGRVTRWETWIGSAPLYTIWG